MSWECVHDVEHICSYPLSPCTLRDLWRSFFILVLEVEYHIVICTVKTYLGYLFQYFPYHQKPFFFFLFLFVQNTSCQNFSFLLFTQCSGNTGNKLLPFSYKDFWKRQVSHYHPSVLQPKYTPCFLKLSAFSVLICGIFLTSSFFKLSWTLPVALHEVILSELLFAFFFSITWDAECHVQV